MDFFKFKPTHKLVLQTNHKPRVQGTDEGIWRRLLLIPFNETIPDGERDRDLADKLRAEAPGILLWAVRGCVAFLKGELKSPEVVRQATRAYRSESDLIEQFIQDECEVDEAESVPVGDAYLRYGSWARNEGIHPLSKRKFNDRLSARGLVTRRATGGTRRWVGLKLA
jgi:putative DNA primase/helicase